MTEIKYHIKLKKGDIGRYIILPGDPGRTDIIASYLEKPELKAFNREFKTWTGYLSGEKVSVTSTGIGGPSTAIAIHELVECGADTFIRVGTCGGMSQEVLPGDLIIPNAAIRKEGLTLEYTPIEFPAVPSYEILNVLVETAKELNISNHVGVVECKDSYYGQHSPEIMPVKNELIEKWEAWIKSGALASEMESASLFIVSSFLKVKSGTILLAMSNQEREKRGYDNTIVYDMNPAITVAINSIKKLIKRDKNE